MTRRQRQRRRHQRRGGAMKRGFLVLLGMTVIGVFIGGLGVVGYIVGVASSAPNITSLKPVDKGATSAVYAANGSRLGFIENDELRTPIPFARMPKVLKDATVAIEDERYYSHKGIDYEGIVRAAVDNIQSGETVQGGSTITMQLVRNLYISKERTFQRKIREAKLAEELENEHTKTWILANYINSVPYGTVGGATAVGAQAAARVFFNKEAENLTLPEAALLAGLPQAPSLYNPFRDPRAAISRRNDVLRQMRRLNMITEAQLGEAQASPLRVKANTYYQTRKESYFFDYVKEQLIQRYGISTVRKGGLKIHTTIDIGKQKAARAAIKENLYNDDDPSSAIVTIDPRTGYIKAMASSGTYAKNKYNYAAQGRRQAGSTFKVMVLMAALREGIDPNSTTYVSRPLSIDDPKFGHWEVKTYGNTYGGAMNLVRATTTSDNTVYAQLILDVGADKVKKAAQDMGITSRLEGYPAEGLGGLKLGVSPLEMANAYATVASGGVRHRPIAVRKVVFPDGRSEDLGKVSGKRAFSKGVSSEATRILEANVQGGTGTGANYGCPVAGKTGTVDEYTDAWFVGYTPKLTTSVWVGYPNSKVSMYSVHGIRVAGGTIPTDIWRDYMAVAHGDDCSSFDYSGEGADFSPYFGKYAGTGRSSDRNYNYQGDGDGEDSDGDGSESQDGGGGGYDPDLYESTPQRAPSAPSGGGGNRGGGGSQGGGGQGGGVSRGGGTSPG